MNKGTLKAAALALTLAALGGCASQAAQPIPDNHADLISRIERAERAAAEASQAAARAQARADEAMTAAQANDTKVDRAFKKSQQK